MICIRVWGGSGSLRVTDMTNANKRGKTCKTFSVDGGYAYQTNNIAFQCFRNSVNYLEKLAGKYIESSGDILIDADFQSVLNELGRINIDSVNLSQVKEIRGVDAPKPTLSAGVPGVWSATADNDDLHLADLTDGYNEPREITTNQTSNKAYQLASKVWDKLADCKTMHEASRILTAAGCRLHYYCAMD